MSRSLRSPVVLLVLLILACSGNVSFIPDGNGHLIELRHEPVRVPGLSYLTLGSPQRDVLSALRAQGFACDVEAASGKTQACIRAPGDEDPKGGEVVLEFENLLLTGVQAQLQPPGDDTGKLSTQRFEALSAQWNREHGRGVEVKRGGITAVRYNLRDRTSLLLIHYDGEPTLIAEHLLMQEEQADVPPGLGRAAFGARG
jgi:hypothetical protein